MVILNSFPIITREIRTKIGYGASTYSFSFDFNGTRFPLESSSTEGSLNSNTNRAEVLKMEDPNGRWHPRSNNLNVDAMCVINAPRFLFGSKGVAAVKSTIGIGILWTAKDAGIRGVFPIGEIKSTDNGPVDITGSVTFQPHTLRGILSLKTILYLKDAGDAAEDEKYLANRPGTILGTMDETRVIIDGKGSLFPIIETNSPGEPLWWVKCEWTDATQDSFSDNFSIYLNRANKNYPSLNENDGLKKSPLLQEIIAGALQILITNVLSDTAVCTDTINGQNLAPGSVSAVVNYFLHSLDVDTNINDPQGMALQLRRSLFGRL